MIITNETTRKSFKLAMDLIKSACEQGAQKTLGYAPDQCVSAFVTAAFEILRAHLPNEEDSVENVKALMHTQVDLTAKNISDLIEYANRMHKPTGLNLIFAFPKD